MFCRKFFTTFQSKGSSLWRYKPINFKNFVGKRLTVGYKKVRAWVETLARF